MNYSLAPLDDHISAALLFMDEQLLLRYRDETKVVNKFISPESAKEAFNLIPSDSGWVPSNVIRHGSFRGEPFAIIHFPSAKRTITVEMSDGETRSFTHTFPAGVFAGFGNSFYIFAVKKFSLQARLYRYPLPNICERTGLICFGSYSPKADLHSINDSLNLFFRATFNDHHITGKSKTFPSDIREALALKSPSFTDLIALEQNAEEVFDRYLSR